MAQFDVYRNPSKKTSKAYPLLVDVQNSVIDQLATRLTVPLIKRSTKSSLYMKNLFIPCSAIERYTRGGVT